MPELIELLTDAVAGGASVGFVGAVSYNQAQAYWRDALLEVRNGHRALLVARDERNTVIGSVQLRLSTPPNGRHRAAVEKLLVLRRARRQGIGRALLNAVEAVAVTEGRRLLVLDVRAADPAEALYAATGWQPAGTIPGYALDHDGTAVAATWWWKQVGRAAGPQEHA